MNDVTEQLSTSETIERLEARAQELRNQEGVLTRQHAEAALRVAKGDSTAAVTLNELVQAMRGSQLEQQAVAAALVEGRKALSREQVAAVVEIRDGALRALAPVAASLVATQISFQKAAATAHAEWLEMRAARRAVDSALDDCGEKVVPKLHNNDAWRHRVAAEPSFSEQSKQYAAMDGKEIADIKEQGIDRLLAEGSKRHAAALRELKRDLHREIQADTGTTASGAH